MNRRDILQMALLGALGASIPLVSSSLGSVSMGKGRLMAQETRAMMGTVVTVSIVDDSLDKAQEALGKTFERMRFLVPIFDRHKGDGPVFTLNRDGLVRDIPRELSDVLSLSQWVNNITGGAFDITVAPVLNVFRDSFLNTGGPPPKEKLRKAISAMGGLIEEKGSLRIVKDGAAITLDGVAKGYIVDQGLVSLVASGIKHALINAGGDVAVLGHSGDREASPWQIAINNPYSEGGHKQVIEMTSGAVATSGSYEMYFDQEKIYHHIIDPSDGLPPSRIVSASVIAPNAILADALSTSCMVLKPRRSASLLKRLPGVENMVITRAGEILSTQGFSVHGKHS